MGSAIRLGMVGLDTSHCVAFTKILNDEGDQYHVPGAEVVAAVPGGSELFSHSRDRVQGFAEQLRSDYGIHMHDSIADLVRGVDAILLESVDGRQHLDQFRQMAAGKPVFIDKPFATSSADAHGIVELAGETETPIMSSSSLRYAAGIADLTGDATVISCEAFGPAAILDDYPGLFWYGIHSAEVLFAFMGAGCTQVQSIHHEDIDVVVGEWADGRTGVLRGTRVKNGAFGCVVHASDGTRCGIAHATPPSYSLLMQQVVEFFKTGDSPIDMAETLGIIAFLEAADESTAQGGRPIATHVC